jgi:hypothetical protein
VAEKDDLDIIAELIDANCRAYNDEYGLHYDSRCLEHYNKGIARLIEGGRVQHYAPSAGKQKKKAGTATAQYDAEVVEGNPIPRMRSAYVGTGQVTRPTTDPMWAIWQKENEALKAENAALKNKTI